MKKIKFKFNSAVLLLLGLVIFLCLGGCAWNIYSAVVYHGFEQLKFFSYLITAILTLAIAVFAIITLLSSHYTVKDDKFILRLGLIVEKTDLAQIVQITHFKKKDKLVVYFSDKKYSVIVIDKEKHDDFIDMLKNQNSAIVVTVDSE